MQFQKTALGMGAIAVLIAVVAIAALYSPSADRSAEAAPPAQEAPQRTITVTGFGSASGSPDIAYMNIGVETVDSDVAVALQENNTRMEAVMSALQDAGIAEEDIRTSNFNIYQDRSFGPGGPPSSEPPAAQYRVNNSVRITVRDIDTVGTILSTAVDAGANVINGVDFGLADRDSLEAEARVKAIEDARARAQQLADEIGAELGEVITVQETFGGAPGPYAEAAGGGGFNAALPISQGTLSVNISLNITFAIQS